MAATGLRAEARLAERAGSVVAVAGGGDFAFLADHVERAIAEGASGVLSFGIAGGLDPELRPGDIVVGNAVIYGRERFKADEIWRQRLATSLHGAGVRMGEIAASDVPVGSRELKAALRQATGAVAVDMESHVAGRLAAQHKLPFAVLRVVGDDAYRSLPPAAVAGLASGGTIDIQGVLKSLLRQPSQLPQLLRVSVDTNKAMASLLRCNRLLGPGLGFADLG